jgi:hypothetical protein
MAISVTEILGTDSLSGSRLVLNDNFNILESEINAMEIYFNPIAGTLNNLVDVKTESFRVGLLTPKLIINGNIFDILTSIKINGDINLNGGLIRNNTDPQILNDVLAGPSMTIAVGTSTASPAYSVERVSNNTTGTLTIELNDGVIGQEIFFVYADATTGTVDIKGAINAIIVQGGLNIQLDEKGKSVHLLCIDDGTGNGEWYVVGGSGYTIS